MSHRVRRYFRGCRLVDPVERTLALIKPDAVEAGRAEAIMARYVKVHPHRKGTECSSSREKGSYFIETRPLCLSNK